ncbi:CU044_5270 family protein [Micromonosporaceae bacterium Da 78-11]
MDEMTLTRELGDETPLPAGARLVPARDRLMAELTASAPSRHRARLWTGVGAAGLVAAAVTGLLVLPPATVTAPPPSGIRSTGTLSLRPAAQVLGLAADATLTEADVVPAPDEFLYRADLGPDGKVIYEIWKSIDGSRPGLVIRYEPGGADRIELPGCPVSTKDEPAEQGGCGYDPAVLPDLPSDPQGLLAYLRTQGNDENEQTLTNSMAKEIWNLSAAHYLRPAQRAALFRAAATVDGLQVLDGVTDAAGRVGTGVSWKYFGSDTTWIFDPRTHRYLGTPQETSRTAIVKQVGEHP